MGSVRLTCLFSFTVACGLGSGDAPGGSGGRPGGDGEAPRLTLLGPDDGVALPDGVPLVVRAAVSDDDTPRDRLEAALLVDGFVVWSGRPEADGSIRAEGPVPDPGPHRWTLSVLDDTGHEVTASRKFRANRAPGTPVVGIDPSSPVSGDVLDVRISSFPVDPDGQPLEVRYAWARDGVVVIEGRQVPRGLVRRGEAWQVTVTVADGVDEVSSTAGPVVIANAPPRVLSARLAPDELQRGGTASVEDLVVSDADDDTFSVSTVWSVDGLTVGTEPTLDLFGLRRGQVVTVEVSAFDGTDTGNVVRLRGVVANGPPGVERVVLVPDAPVTGDVLTAVPTGADADGDDVSWVYAWWVDGVPVQTGPRATWSGTRGQSVEVIATGTDDLGASASVRSQTVVIGNAPPALDAVELRSVTYPEITELVCTATGRDDREGDAVSLRWSWWLGGVRVDDAEWSTLFEPAGLVTTTAVCVATPWDGLDEGTPVASAPVRAGNLLPVVDAPMPTLPEVVVPGRVLQLDVPAFHDPDGDAVSASVEWWLDDAVVGTGATFTVPVGRDRRLSAAVVFAESRGTLRVFTEEARIGNALPSLRTFSVSGTTRKRPPTVSSGAVDADGDAVSTTFAWTKNGVEVQTGAARAISAPILPGDVVSVVAMLDDGHGGIFVSDPLSVVVEDVAPTVNVVWSPTWPSLGQAFQCGAVVADEEDDPVTVSVAWSRSGQPYAGPVETTVYPGDTIPASASEAVPWTCSLTVSDPWRSRTASFTLTPRGPRVIPVGSTVWLTDDAPYGFSTLQVDGTLFVDGAAIVVVDDLIVNGTVNGAGPLCTPYPSPTLVDYSGAGGAGRVRGGDGLGTTAASVNVAPGALVFSGCTGTPGKRTSGSTPGGRGGPGLLVRAERVVIAGVVDLSGDTPTTTGMWGGGGGGGGGWLRLDVCESLAVTGSVWVAGGDGGVGTDADGGGGGGGGLVVRVPHAVDLSTWDFDRSGGVGYRDGGLGQLSVSQGACTWR